MDPYNTAPTKPPAGSAGKRDPWAAEPVKTDRSKSKMNNPFLWLSQRVIARATLDRASLGFLVEVSRLQVARTALRATLTSKWSAL